jgi:hypothetical protein
VRDQRRAQAFFLGVELGERAIGCLAADYPAFTGIEELLAFCHVFVV